MMRSTTTVRTLAAFCALHLTLLANTVWANDNLRFSDDFAQPGVWAHENANDKASGFNGALRVERPGSDSSSRYTQAVTVRPAAAWRASIDMSLMQFDAKDVRGRAGLAIIGALGSILEVQLDHQGDVLVGYYDGNSWTRPNPVQFAKATAARLGKGAVNTLSIERDAGFFRIFVNDVFVARTRIIDITPRHVGITVDSKLPLVVELDNLKLEEIGKDSRYVRLLNIVGTPGAQELLVDKFDNASNWLSNDDDQLATKVSDGRYLVTGKTNETNYSLFGNANLGHFVRSSFPVGFQVSARTTYLAGDGSYARGISIKGKKVDAQASTYLELRVTNTHLQVINTKQDGSIEALLPWTESPSLRANGDNWLNMSVLADGRVLIFVNFDYQATVQMPDWYKPRDLHGIGVLITGPQSVAFDNFYAREF